MGSGHSFRLGLDGVTASLFYFCSALRGEFPKAVLRDHGAHATELRKSRAEFIRRLNASEAFHEAIDPPRFESDP
jgi:hypothetical protein